MSKAIKFKNNVYLDTRGAVHNGTILKTYLDTKTIYDSGSNALGSYIRFQDGTMICWKTTPSMAVNITNRWENIYYGKITTIYNYAMNFISTPVIIWDVIPDTSTGCFKVSYEAPVITSSGISNLSVARPNSRAGVSVKLWFIAFGKWK